MPDGRPSGEFDRRFQATLINREPRLERFSRTRGLPIALFLLGAVVGSKAAIQIIEQNEDTSMKPGATEQFHQNPWADEVRIRIQQKNPNEGEKIKKDLMVTDGGEPQVEYVDNQPVLTDSVEVYIGFPSPIYPEGDNMTPSGRIALGADIDKALMTDGIIIDYEPGSDDGLKPIRARYGAFEKGNLEIIGSDHKPLDLDPRTIIAIPATNLAPQNPQQ